MTSQIVIQSLVVILSLLKSIISFIEMILRLQNPVPVPEHDFSNIFNHIINIPGGYIPDTDWHFSSPNFINNISLHRRPHTCRYRIRCYSATFLCGSCYYNSFGDLTKCGYLSYSDDWSHDCLGHGFQFGVDPPHIPVENPESDWSSDHSDEYIYNDD